MTPWSYEGGEFFPEESSKNYLYLNPTIERFLTVGKHDRKFFLLAPKGNGKTLLIRYKAYLYWNTGQFAARGRAAGVKSYQNELVENIQLSLGSFSGKDISRFSDAKSWRRLWKFSITYFILANYAPEKLEKYLSQLIQSKNSVGSIATELLNTTNRGHLEHFYIYEAVLNNLLYEINFPVVHFLDRLDQNIGEIINDDGGLGRSKFDSNAVDLWVSAQVGLMLAIYDINSTNAHVKIYATIRSEAFVPNKFDNDLYQNINNYTTHLRYSKEELRIIFNKNIELMSKGDLVDPGAENPAKRFFGFTMMTHRLAKDKDGTPREEQVFDFIYRHTYGRPREIVLQGRAIHDELVTKPEYGNYSIRERTELVREVVNETAYQRLFMPYIKELIPAFRQEEFENFCKKTHCNVISEKEMLALNHRDFLNYLYRIGLLGYVKTGMDEGSMQRFLAAGEYIFVQDTALPRSPYYLTHPTIDRQLLAHSYIRPFYNRYNIIGDSYPFYYIGEDQQQPIDFNLFVPRRIVSDVRWTAPGECFQAPIQDYVKAFFRVDNPNFNEHIEKQVQRFLNGMHTVGRLIIFRKLEAGSNNRSYQEMLKECERNIGTMGIRQEYAEELGAVDAPQTMERFATKYFGRNITAAATLFLNLNCQQIHCLLTNPTMDFERHATSGESSFRYLRRCFFLDGLTQQAFQDIAQKNVIFSNLSQFGQEMLLQFRREFISEFRSSPSITNRDKGRLEKEFIENIFLPATF